MNVTKRGFYVDYPIRPDTGTVHPRITMLAPPPQ